MVALARIVSVVLALLAFCLPFSSAAWSQSREMFLFHSDAYAPALSADNDPICEGLLKDVRAHFLTPKAWETYPRLNLEFQSLQLATQSDLVEEPSVPDTNRVVVVEGKKLFFALESYRGCGGACETEGFQVSDIAIPYGGKAKSTTVNGHGWSLYKDAQGRFFTVGIEERKRLHLYRLTADAGLALSCTAELTPVSKVLEADDAWKTASCATALLKRARDRIAGGAGPMCGSMKTDWRWSGYVDEALAEALYRPWALVKQSDGRDYRAVSLPGNLSANSGGDYTRILLSLEDWSLGGLSEYRAMSAYRDQLAATITAVTRFYGAKFHWSHIDTRALAEHALTTAISRGFGFYLYEPFASASERKLRRAILEHWPMAEIEAIHADLRTTGKGRGESLLNIAVAYPAALRYLLAQGADPNEANGFGKTPLMYAAQYNQEQSTAILLDAGADPNAGTVWPSNTCYYALQTANMTPLHYAVRYASATLVRSLLNHGAKAYLKTEKLPYLGKDGEYPVDWFRTYTAPDSKEPNPNIPPLDIQALEVLLALPDGPGRAAIAERLAGEADAADAKGETTNALRFLKEALSVQSDNDHVHRTLLRIALKAEPGLVLKTTAAAIAANKSDASVAAAWFDQGIVCEQAGAGGVYYENRSYCSEPRISPFFRSYRVAPSDAARAKLLSLFNDGGIKSCTVTINAVPARYQVANAYLYVLHPNSFKIDPQSIAYPDSKTGDVGHPRISESIDLGDGQSITSLWYGQYNRQPVVVGGQTCGN
jgi:hypothetical protein